MGDPNNQKSQELDRSASLRASMRRSQQYSQLDDDDDDYAISDGFRPVNVAPNPPQSHNPPSRESALQQPPKRPSSISKPIPRHESFSLRHDGHNNRLSMMSTHSNQVHPETPYDGPSGPSHPYQMYPQDVRLARTASMATTSTAPISERSYNGPRGPTHPYGIYPQDVGHIEEVDLGHPVARTNMVGFPGTTDQYQRRIGPDGEEVADLIGPDGHTEQLPPYTRYPDHPYAQKTQAVAVEGDNVQASPVLAISSAPSAPIMTTAAAGATTTALEIPGAGGIGRATRNPEFASTEDFGRLGSPQSRQSIRSFVSDVSHHDINTAALAVTNEKTRPQKWRSAARRKVWGFIPCWCVVICMIVLVLLGVLVGVLIGIYYGRHHNRGPPHNNNNNPTPYQDQATSTTDTIPLSTPPPGMRALSTGNYAFPLIDSRHQNECFADSSQNQAWNCDEIMAQLEMSVQRLDHMPLNQNYAITLTYNKSWTLDSNYYSYGVQPPSLANTITLYLVNDTSTDTLVDPTLGTAWFQQFTYNKTILLPEQFIPPPNGSSAKMVSDGVEKRQIHPFNMNFHRKGVAQSGEKPWICEWPATTLEIFIYVFQNATNNRPMDFGNGGPGNGGGEQGYGSPTAFPAPSATSSGAYSAPTGYFSPANVIPLPLPQYPLVIKVNERRNTDAQAPPPTCRQVIIQQNGMPAAVSLDANGNPVEETIQLLEIPDGDETKMPWLSRQRQRPNLQNRDDAGSSQLSDCGCIWIQD
ncbi:hypothetical protein F5Y16DRAFT_371779 [Xylariaceae sp. FL0255]|nr:hypothetical protein F5Y16DRAFT_371779 [Xylariaceae sp. FL0255]